MIRQTKDKTDKPFAVNLFAHSTSVAVDQVQLESMQQLLKAIYGEFRLPYEHKSPADFTFYNYLDQVEVLINEQWRAGQSASHGQRGKASDIFSSLVEKLKPFSDFVP